MNLTISYAKADLTVEFDSGIHTLYRRAMNICINNDENSQRGFWGDNQNGRTLRIIKERSENHYVFHSKTNHGNCDSCISIVLLTPGKEWQDIKVEFEKIARPRTCDYCVSGPNVNFLRSSPKGALRACEAIARVSKDHFGPLKEQWFNEAKVFILNQGSKL